MKKIIQALFPEDGYSLVEVVVSMAVFMILALALSSLFISSYKTVVAAGTRSAAVQHVQQEMEKSIAEGAYSADEVQREEDYEVVVFGKKVTGTLITVDKIISEEPLRRVTYVTFVPDE